MTHPSARKKELFRSVSITGPRVCALLLIFGFALYANSLANGYAVDDQLIIENNRLTSRGVAAIPEILTSNYIWQEDRGAAYRAVPRISYAIEYELFGQAPHVSHLVNLLLYCLAGIAVWRWMSLLFPAAPPALPLAVALLFLAHPVHAEVVDNLKSRDELMSFLFGALSVIAFLHFSREGSRRWLAGGLLAFALALTSRESGQQFLGVVPLAMYFRDGWRPRRLGVAVAGLLIVTLAFWGLMYLFLNRDYTFWMVAAVQDFRFVENPLLFVADPDIRYGTAFYSMGYYLRLLIWPHPLSFFYGYGVIPLVGFSNGWVLLSLGAYVGLTVFAFASLARRTIPGFAVCYFLGTLLMFSNLLVPMSGTVAERYVFTASLGFCVFLGWVLTRTRGAVFLGLLLVVLLAYGVGTFDRNRDWKDRRTLAERDVRSFPNSAMIQGMLFQLDHDEARTATDPALRARKAAAAMERLSEIERIYPPYRTRAALARGQFQLHLLDSPAEALQNLQRALALAEEPLSAPHPDRSIDVKKSRIHFELAQAYARLGLTSDARGQLQKAVAEHNRESSDRLDPRAIADRPLDDAIDWLAPRIDSF